MILDLDNENYQFKVSGLQNMTSLKMYIFIYIFLEKINICIHIYIIAKVKFPKTYTIVHALYAYLNFIIS